MVVIVNQGGGVCRILRIGRWRVCSFRRCRTLHSRCSRRWFGGRFCLAGRVFVCRLFGLSVFVCLLPILPTLGFCPVCFLFRGRLCRLTGCSLRCCLFCRCLLGIVGRRSGWGRRCGLRLVGGEIAVGRAVPVCHWCRCVGV